jgi:hypothetical protein
MALKVTSGLATVALAFAGVMAYRAAPLHTGFTRVFGVGVALVFPAIVAGAGLFMVTGYEVAGGDLLVQRPLWSTRIPLAGLTVVRHEPTLCRGSLRIFGNGGMYSFTGLYRNRALGRFRLLGTDLKRAVVLALDRRVVVVTPAEPEAFAAYLGQLYPGARVEAAHGLGGSAPRVGRGSC